MTILSQCAAIEVQLEAIKRRDGDAKTIKSLIAKHEELSSACTALRMELDRGTVYHLAGYGMRLQSLPASLEPGLEELGGKLRHDPAVENLSEGALWPNLIADLGETTHRASLGANAARTAFRDAHSNVTPPSDLIPQLAPTDRNRAKIGEYKQVYSSFDRLVKEPVHSANQIEEIRSILYPRLRDIASEMDTDIPPEVQAFLRAVETPVGAPLSNLTPGVLQWLGSRGMISRFRVAKLTKV